MGLRRLTKTVAPGGRVEQSLIPAVYAGNGDSTDSSTLDLDGWAGGLFVIEVGNSGDTLAAGLAITLVLEHSDTDTAGAAVDSNDLVVNDFVTEATGVIALINAPAEDSAVFTVEYKANHPNAKRYINIRMDRTGNHANGTPVSITGIKLHPMRSNADGY
jgi:hypothetical protein